MTLYHNYFLQVKLFELQTQLGSLGVSEFSNEQDIRTLNHHLEQLSNEVDEGVTMTVELKTIRQIMLDIGKSRFNFFVLKRP